MHVKKNIDRFNLSIIPSVRCSGICSNFFQLLGLYQWNNSVGNLTVAAAFTVILFQLFEIYRRNYFVDNPVSNILKIFFKKTIGQK
jgi:hypothetical protein